jgi:hypothetical protein
MHTLEGVDEESIINALAVAGLLGWNICFHYVC